MGDVDDVIVVDTGVGVVPAERGSHDIILEVKEEGVPGTAEICVAILRAGVEVEGDSIRMIGSRGGSSSPASSSGL